MKNTKFDTWERFLTDYMFEIHEKQNLWVDLFDKWSGKSGQRRYPKSNDDFRIWNCIEYSFTTPLGDTIVRLPGLKISANAFTTLGKDGKVCYIQIFVNNKLIIK